MYRLFLFAFFLSACASGRIKYWNTEEVSQDREKKFAQNERVDISSDTVNLTESELVTEELSTNLSEQKYTYSGYNNSAERLLDRIKEQDQSTYEQINSVYERVSKNEPASHSEEATTHKRSGNALLILGLIFLILATLFATLSDKVDVSDNSVEGCIGASMEMMALGFLAVLFGIGAVIFLFIGLIVKFSSRSDS